METRFIPGLGEADLKAMSTNGLEQNIRDEKSAKGFFDFLTAASLVEMTAAAALPFVLQFKSPVPRRFAQSIAVTGGLVGFFGAVAGVLGSIDSKENIQQMQQELNSRG